MYLARINSCESVSIKFWLEVTVFKPVKKTFASGLNLGLVLIA